MTDYLVSRSRTVPLACR